MEHGIDTGTANPIRLPPYRLPHAYRETVQKELKEMMESGTIEKSSSEWAAPIVLVVKDGSIRMCVDYIQTSKFCVERGCLPNAMH